MTLNRSDLSTTSITNNATEAPAQGDEWLLRGAVECKWRAHQHLTPQMLVFCSIMRYIATCSSLFETPSKGWLEGKGMV